MTNIIVFFKVCDKEGLMEYEGRKVRKRGQGSRRRSAGEDGKQGEMKA